MKLTALALLSALPLAAQTTPPAHHATTHPVARKSASGCPADADLAALSTSIPKIAGCPKALYSLRYVDTLVGTGALAEPRKFYNVDYTGYLPDGTVFDSSKDHGPITFPQGAGRVIPGFDTAFEGMHIGGKRRVFIPYEIAYGPLGVPKQPNRPGNGIPPKTMLIFDLTLNSISDTPPRPPTPPAGAAKPATPGATPAPGTTPAKPATPGSAPTPGGTTPPPSSTTPPPSSATPQPGSAQTVVGKPTTPTTPPAPTTDPTKPTTTTPPQR